MLLSRSNTSNTSNTESQLPKTVSDTGVKPADMASNTGSKTTEEIPGHRATFQALFNIRNAEEEMVPLVENKSFQERYWLTSHLVTKFRIKMNEGVTELNKYSVPRQRRLRGEARKIYSKKLRTLSTALDFVIRYLDLSEAHCLDILSADKIKKALKEDRKTPQEISDRLSSFPLKDSLEEQMRECGKQLTKVYKELDLWPNAAIVDRRRRLEAMYRTYQKRILSLQEETYIRHIVALMDSSPEGLSPSLIWEQLRGISEEERIEKLESYDIQPVMGLIETRLVRGTTYLGLIEDKGSKDSVAWKEGRQYLQEIGRIKRKLVLIIDDGARVCRYTT